MLPTEALPDPLEWKSKSFSSAAKGNIHSILKSSFLICAFWLHAYNAPGIKYFSIRPQFESEQTVVLAHLGEIKIAFRGRSESLNREGRLRNPIKRVTIL